VPFLALDAETYNVALVEVELCLIVAPDVDLLVLFAVQKLVRGLEYRLLLRWKVLGRMAAVERLQQGREKSGNEQVRIWKE
jgi:hypothetical protein